MNFNSKIKIILLLLFLFLASLSAAFFLRSKRENRVIPVVTPQPVLTVPTDKPLDLRSNEITLTVPADGAENVSPDTDITITFAAIPDPDLLKFSITPETESLISFSGNKMIINPAQDLTPGTQYTWIIKFNSDALPSKTYSFKTVGTFKGPHDTEPVGAAQEELQFQMENHADVFLNNHTPYSSSSFDLTSDFIGGEGGHFRFTVLEKTDSGETDFQDYLSSLGLDESQISTLDVIFQKY